MENSPHTKVTNLAFVELSALSFSKALQKRAFLHIYAMRKREDEVEAKVVSP